MTLRDGDYMQDIVKYIEKNINIGYNKDELRFMLIRRGYSRSAIEKSFRTIEQRIQSQKTTPQQKPTPKVVLIDGKDEPQKEKSLGFFSQIKKWFKSSTPSKPSPKKINHEQDETVRIDENGNLIH